MIPPLFPPIIQENKMKKTPIPIHFFAFLLLLFYVSPTSSTTFQPSDRLQTFIIHVSPSHKPSAFPSHEQWYSSLLRSLPSPHPTKKLLYTYSTALHGFSARLTASQAAALRRLPSVLSVLPDRVRHVHTTRTPHFLGLADSSGLWPNSDYADDVIIGVLDTGIWPDRRSFSDEGLSPVPSGWKGKCESGPDFPATACNRKLIGARAFLQGYDAEIENLIHYAASNFTSRIKRDRAHTLDVLIKKRNFDRVRAFEFLKKLKDDPKSPLDTEGHGTHTASTAAGSVVPNASLYDYARGEARGMAIKARIAVYKICWSLGCFDSDILAAMDQSVADGVHVISLSVGASGKAPQYDRDSIAIGAFGAARHGVIVSCSAGNSGPGPFTAVNIAPWILTVGASTIDREFPADVILGDGRVFGGVSLYSGDQLGDSKLPLVNAADCGDRYCYSGKLESAKVAGKIVICDRGGNARVAKGGAVKVAGGAGLIIANTADSGEELVADSHLIAATMVGQIAGNKIKDYVKSDPSPTATIVFKGTVYGTSPPAPRVAAFSSRGPNYLTAEILKPDVIAPGVNILAGWTGYTSPTDLDIDPRRVDFNIISGTSMSCPHVSGLAALLRKAYPEWTPAAIKSALMTTSYNLDNTGRNFTDLATGGVSTPFIHGAGHVDPNRALNPGLVYDIHDPDYMAFLCAIGYDAKRIAIFVKDHTVDCSAMGLGNPGDLNYPSFSVAFDSSKSVVKYKRTVKNVGNAVDAVYHVKASAPRAVEINVSPNKLVFSEGTRTLSYEVTFTSVVALGEFGVASQGFGSIEWTDGTHSVRSPIAVVWQQGPSAASM